MDEDEGDGLWVLVGQERHHLASVGALNEAERLDRVLDPFQHHHGPLVAETLDQDVAHEAHAAEALPDTAAGRLDELGADGDDRLRIDPSEAGDLAHQPLDLLVGHRAQHGCGLILAQLKEHDGGLLGTRQCQQRRGDGGIGHLRPPIGYPAAEQVGDLLRLRVDERADRGGGERRLGKVQCLLVLSQGPGAAMA